MPRVQFTTLGCRLNQAESDSMAEDLATRGVDVGTAGERPDLIVINTCTVTREATKASRQAIRRAVKNNPDGKVVVIGCYAVSNPEEIEAIEGVDAILSNDDKESFLEALESRQRGLLQIGTPSRKRSLPHRVRANLKVQTGCDEWCSFCIIPKTRGPLRSIDFEDLIAEAGAKVAAGAREIVLTGVHLGKYAYDSGGDEGDLIRLLQRLLDIEGLWRLRLSSILSQHLTEEVVDFIASEPRICRFLHVPLQSGDDDVLRAMNRPYDIGGYLDSIRRARERIEGLALATDIIVGFPGESDEAFEATLDVVTRVRFSKLHVFRYSARPDTSAAAMTDLELTGDVKRARSKRLIRLGNQIRGDWLGEHIGPSLEVLVEEERKVDGLSICSGMTGDFVRVWFEGAGLLGQLVNVEGARVRADGLEGRLVGATSPSVMTRPVGGRV
jgi:threonylcarbamoyladenosine tRNA methylthiotransferase MtaB